jgi:SWI/SNF chromatin-remodeling complex subunit SWI1
LLSQVTQQGAWGQVVAHFDLPEQTTVPQLNGQQSVQSVARVLQHYYQAILGGFEEVYKRNVSEQHRKALSGQTRPGDPQASPARMAAGSHQAGPSSQPSQQGAGGGVGNVMGMVGPISNAQSSGASANSAAPFPLQPTPQSPHLHQQPGTPSMQSTAPNISGVDGSLPQSSITEYPAQATPKVMLDHEQDGLSHKRKLESEEDDAKRARQKIGKNRICLPLRIIDE